MAATRLSFWLASLRVSPNAANLIQLSTALPALSAGTAAIDPRGNSRLRFARVS